MKGVNGKTRHVRCATGQVSVKVINGQAGNNETEKISFNNDTEQNGNNDTLVN